MFDSNKIYNSNANWFQNSQGNYDYVITYGPNQQRRKTVLQSGIGDDVLLTKYYASGDYEKEVTPTGTRHLHYISGGDGLAAIYVKYSNAPDSLYFIINDHLGSLVGAINSQTGTVYRQNFDACSVTPGFGEFSKPNPMVELIPPEVRRREGRKRNPDNWSYTNIPNFPFDRGYTGHEHLKWFGLINMNGRMYDAAICRFLSPDPYVQMPDYSQNFNRYSYALNNPLIYSDPSGEFLGSIFTGITEYFKAVGQTLWDFGETILVDGGLEFWHGSSGDAWADFNSEFNNNWAKFDPTTPGNKTNNALRIDAGLFLHIPGWETPQTLLGNVISHGRNLTGNVDNVEIKNWTVLVNDNDPDNPTDKWGMTFGPYINSHNIKIGSDIYYHGLGHTMQSRILGPLYISKVAVPSGLSAWYSYYLINDYGEYHDNTWYEVWASRLGGAPNHKKKYRKQSFWYWWCITILPFYPN